VMERARQTYQQQRRPFPRAGTQQYKLLQNQALQFLVQQAEYRQEAENMDVRIPDEKVDERIEQIKKQYFGGSQKRYEAHLKRQRLTEAQVRHDVEQQLIAEGIYEKLTSEVKVSDADITSYYGAHKSDFKQAESRDVRHILVPAKKKALADRLYRQLQDGANFAKLARQYSTDTTTKKQGGKLTVTRGSTVAPFDHSAFLLGRNTISQPIKTQYGWHIIQPVSEIRPERTTPLKDVKEQIRQQLLQERQRKAVNDWVASLKKDYEDDIEYQVGYAPPKPASTTTTG
jgi:parvulin-like peptidyl-prolyl isomerase